MFVRENRVRRLFQSNADLACLLLLALHAAIAVHSLRQHSTTIDEGQHLSSGMSFWEGRLSDYRVNPPLVKALAALPIFASRPTLPEITVTDTRIERHRRFAEANQSRYQAMIFRARYVIVALSLVGGWVIYHWSKTLFGNVSAVIAVALWSLSPNVLAWCGVATTDLGATVLGLVATYSVWQYSRRPDLQNAFLSGLLIGLAQLAKFTLLVLYPIWFVVWASCFLRAWRQRSSAQDTPERPTGCAGPRVLDPVGRRAAAGIAGSQPRLRVSGIRSATGRLLLS